MRISDWSSDVCSSDLKATVADLAGFFQVQCRAAKVSLIVLINSEGPLPTAGGQTGVDAQIRFEGKTFPIVMNEQPNYARQDRTSVVVGKRVSVRVDLGGRRIITKKKRKHTGNI